MLTDAVDGYLAVRRSAGYKLVRTGALLHRYARFAAERGETHVRTDTAVEWAGAAGSQPQRYKRLRAVTHFARYVRAEDAQHQIPPDGVFPCRRERPTPYIFSPREIQLLIEHAGRLGPPGTLQPVTYRTCVTLLAVTGLRVSEALSLRIEDLTPDGLVIRETKFRKSRLVPLHATTHEALASYADRRLSVADGEDHLFVTHQGKRLTYPSLARAFTKAKDAAGIAGDPDGPKPRLHSLRHTFAVRALEACSEDRDAIRQHMVALSTYLGHAKIECTYWYLESTPQLMADIAGACESMFNGEEQS